MTAIHDAAKANLRSLIDAGVKGTFYESRGAAHERHTWRRSLHEFAPTL